jgi:hypothetical protein
MQKRKQMSMSCRKQVMRSSSKKRSKSPPPHKSLTKTQKTSDLERRRLARLPKPELEAIIKLAGEVPDQKIPESERTKSYLAHVISRNPLVSSFIASGGGLVAGGLFGATLKHFLQDRKRKAIVRGEVPKRSRRVGSSPREQAEITRFHENLDDGELSNEE